MNNLYVVSWWMPFPVSEYGGLLVISAKDPEELWTIMFKLNGEYELEELGVKTEEEFIELLKDRGLIDQVGSTQRPSGVIRCMLT